MVLLRHQAFFLGLLNAMPLVRSLMSSSRWVSQPTLLRSVSITPHKRAIGYHTRTLLFPSVVTTPGGEVDGASSLQYSHTSQRHLSPSTTCLSMVRRNYRINAGGSSNGSSRRNNNRRPRSPPPPMPSPGSPGRGCFKELIMPGLDVWVVQKADQRSGEETQGTVGRLLTNSPHHPRGIKVMLVSGQVGRVTRIVDDT